MVSFTSRRSEPELLSPARATPRETKALSDLDDQRMLRYYETVVGFFRSNSSRPDNPAKAIKVALAEALVYYYPIAGRLREAAGGKLVVDCTAEGVVFVEACADVRLEEFGQPLLPPYPCVEELLCDVGDTRTVVGKPLLLMQNPTLSKNSQTSSRKVKTSHTKMAGSSSAGSWDYISHGENEEPDVVEEFSNQQQESQDITHEGGL